MELTNNNIIENNEEITVEKQNSFIESALGKTINFGLDIGLRALLPDFIEDQIIDIKDTFFKEGFKEGLNKIVSSAINLGKSALGIFTGNFENVSQVKTVVKNGGIIDGVSDLVNDVVNKAVNKGKIPYNIGNTIKQGKNVILNSITNKIEDEFNNQLDAEEKLQKYCNNWKQYFNNKDFDGMKKEYEKIREKIKILIPMENTLKQARTIENLHILIKNNGQDFNLSEEELQLASLLT